MPVQLALGFDAVEVGAFQRELAAQLFEAQKVGVHRPAADFIAARLGQLAAAVAAQHGPQNHHRAAQRAGLRHKLGRVHVVEVDVLGLETVGVGGQLAHFHAQVAQQLNELVDVADVGNVADGDGLRRQQYRAENLEGFVFGALGRDFAAQRFAAAYFKCSHYVSCSFKLLSCELHSLRHC